MSNIPNTDEIAAKLRECLDTVTSGPYEARFAKNIPTSCVDYGVVSLTLGKEVTRVWDENDARYQQYTSPENIQALLDERKEMKSLLASLGYQTVRDWKAQEEG